MSNYKQPDNDPASDYALLKSLRELLSEWDRDIHNDGGHTDYTREKIDLITDRLKLLQHNEKERRRIHRGERG